MLLRIQNIFLSIWKWTRWVPGHIVIKTWSKNFLMLKFLMIIRSFILIPGVADANSSMTLEEFLTTVLGRSFFFVIFLTFHNLIRHFLIILFLSGRLKVIRKFFIKHNKSFRWHLGDYEIFSIWRPVRGETLIFVCSYGCVVGPLKTGLYKLNGGIGRRHAGLLSQTLKWKKKKIS